MPGAQDSSGVKVFPPVIYIVAIGTGFLIQWLVPMRFGASLRQTALIAGCLLLAVAVALIAWTARLMFRSGTTPNPRQPTTALVFRGPYRVTRNPMYLALELICIGVGLVSNTIWPMVMAVPAAVVTRMLVIDKEERYLEGKFGADYLAYKARVRRWI